MIGGAIGYLALMFKINPSPTFTATVKLSRPGDDKPVLVRMTFRHKTRRELDAWLAGASQFDSDAEFLDAAIESWTSIVDDAGAPVPYSREALAQLLNAFPSAGPEITLQYRHLLADARQKN